MLVILSNIHSNQEVLTVKLALLLNENITAIYCTGDLVEFPEMAMKWLVS